MRLLKTALYALATATGPLAVATAAGAFALKDSPKMPEPTAKAVQTSAVPTRVAHMHKPAGRPDFVAQARLAPLRD